MPRRGWSAIATPSGWYEVIGGPRPPLVQCPLASKGKGKGKGKHLHPSFQHFRRVRRWPRRSCTEGLGKEQSTAMTALEEALKVAKEDVPKPMHPQQRTAEASARVGRLEAALQMLAEDDPDAEPLKVALKKARVLAQVRRSLPPVRRTSEETSGSCRRPSQRSSFNGREVGQRVERPGGLSTVRRQHKSRDGVWKPMKRSPN